MYPCSCCPYPSVKIARLLDSFTVYFIPLLTTTADIVPFDNFFRSILRLFFTHSPITLLVNYINFLFYPSSPSYSYEEDVVVGGEKSYVFGLLSLLHLFFSLDNSSSSSYNRAHTVDMVALREARRRNCVCWIIIEVGRAKA